MKKLLPSEDIFHYVFETADKVTCALVYADGLVNKQLLGDLIARPLSKLNLSLQTESQPQSQASQPQNTENADEENAAPKAGKTQNEGGRALTNDNSASQSEEKSPENKSVEELRLQVIRRAALFPELKEKRDFDETVKEILDGNIALLIDGIAVILIVGAKFLPVRTIMEPPTDFVIKGPREGFIEDIKVNMTLVRKRLKTPKLQFETLKIGRQTDTTVTLCYLNGIVNEQVKQDVLHRLKQIDVDCILDSSYISAFISPRGHSLFKQIGTTEKPDVFAGKIAEGRVGILVDGSPIALTVPFVLTEDFQSSEDYFISPFTATIFRALRFIALVVALLLPALYVSAQLFKMQLVPLGLMLTIASSSRELPLSPSLEMFVVLLLLEILKEASIRMPKYVGMSLSVVGALVLGETAVNAGILSTPAIIVVAFSGICLYTVPNFVETGSILRWIFLIVGGSLGPFGIVLSLAFLLYYLLSTDSFNAPLLAPFSPFSPKDMRDSLVKYGAQNLTKRPALFGSPNKTRIKIQRIDKEQKS